MTTSRGYFITFEGCDRAGKSTQIKLLQQYFQNNNFNVMSIAFPHYDTDIGQLIKKKLHNGNTNPKELHLLFCANRHELQSHIQNYTDSGITILCDRYKDSGIAYGADDSSNFKWFNYCDIINFDPDYVIYLDIDPEITSRRNDFGNGGIYEKVAIQQRVRRNYLKLIQDNWLVINANQNPQQVHRDIVEMLFKRNIISDK